MPNFVSWLSFSKFQGTVGIEEFFVNKKELLVNKRPDRNCVWLRKNRSDEGGMPELDLSLIAYDAISKRTLVEHLGD